MNYEISPLDNNNGYKEGSVAGILKNLSLPIINITLKKIAIF
jgi:hypothetical protein